MRRRKYGNTKITVDGIQFDSKREAARYQELRLLERAGVISFLQRQAKFQLIPNQYAPSDETYTKGPRKGQRKPGKLLEHECSYIADFATSGTVRPLWRMPRATGPKCTRSRKS